MIEFKKLSKSFGKHKVLNEIDLTIEEGKITFIVGPNGSGKTTLLKSLLDIVKGVEGNIIIDNYTLNGKCDYRNNIGYMPQNADFPENLSVKEVIKMVKELRYKTKIYDEELFNEFDIPSFYKQKIKNLSGGTQQKVNASIAFLFQPNILILDEPTAGLDPLSSIILKRKIIKEKEKGKSIIVTSHILSDLEDLANQIVFMMDGNIEFNGSIKEIKDFNNSDDLESAIASLMANGNMNNGN